MGKLTIVLGLVCLMLPAGIARAQDDDDDNGEEQPYTREGWYVSLNATYAVEYFSGHKVVQSDEKVSTGHKNSWGGNARLGYRFNPVASFELQWEGLEEFSESTGSGTKIDGWVGTGNLKASLPFDRLQPYAIFGAGMMQARTRGKSINSDTKESFVIRGGGGIDFYVTENIVASSDVTYVFPTEDNKNTDYLAISWGLTYRF